MKTLSILLIASLSILIAGNAVAVEQVHVQALLGKKAVVMIDGQRRTLSVGETSPEGVKLVETNKDHAVLEIDGVKKPYQLGGLITTTYTKPSQLKETVYADRQGMFKAIGTINGRTVRFLLDTGATNVAMNKAQAKQLGVNYRMHGEPVTISTASEDVRGYRVRLKSVSLGRIKQRNVEAMVIDGYHPGPILLGMSFLGKLKVEKEGDAMTIRQRN